MQLTQEQLAELIAKVLANLDEKRKALKEDGGDVGAISVEDILAEVANIIGEIGEPDGEIEPSAAKSEENDGADDGAVPPELIAKIIEAIEGVKAAKPATHLNRCNLKLIVNMLIFSSRPVQAVMVKRRASSKPVLHQCRLRNVVRQRMECSGVQ